MRHSELHKAMVVIPFTDFGTLVTAAEDMKRVSEFAPADTVFLTKPLTECQTYRESVALVMAYSLEVDRILSSKVDGSLQVVDPGLDGVQVAFCNEQVIELVVSRDGAQPGEGLDLDQEVVKPLAKITLSADFAESLGDVLDDCPHCGKSDQFLGLSRVLDVLQQMLKTADVKVDVHRDLHLIGGEVPRDQ